MRRNGDWARVWRLPVAAGVASALGLVAGLLLEGPADALAWAGLAVPILLSLPVLVRALLPRQPDRR
ncbi:hypothetical protein [Thiohalospira sp.]|uniref:hypothetical protein n=1 Tax=Thiohalospira sp. TaxID=3080549 RepID=UPI00397EB9E2